MNTINWTGQDKKNQELSVFEEALILYSTAIFTLGLFSFLDLLMGVYSIETLVILHVTVMFSALAIPRIWFQEKKNRKAPEEQDIEL